jgi:hypothetical protein
MSGLQSLDAQQTILLQGQILELGNFYMPGLQASFSELLQAVSDSLKTQVYTEAIDKMNYIRSLLKKGKAHTLNKAADLEAFPNMGSSAESDISGTEIEEQLGYAWKLAELEERGLKRSNEEILQLSFNVVEDLGRRRWSDEGVWISLSDGRIFYTRNYRPFKAASRMKADDTTFAALTIADLYVYPGEINPRVRWESAVPRQAEFSDIAKVLSFARKDYAAVVKQVKNQSKNALSDKNPIFLLKTNRIVQSKDGDLALADQSGAAVSLKFEDFSYLLRKMSWNQLEGSAVVCRFGHDFSKSLLYAVPLSVVTKNGVVRLAY